MKKQLTTIVLLLVFLVGLSVLLYPTVSNIWNSHTQSKVITDYSRKISQLSDADYSAALEAANEYNQQLLTNTDRFDPTDSDLAEYDSILNIGGDQVMGVLEIPKIGVKLPIYHGTSAAVLQVGIGHLVGSSLPVGGPSTHAVISGHTALPSAQLLTRLDELKVGDRFIITVLDETLTYEVDEINTVLPDDMSLLGIEPGQDLVTLITCTPPSINTHRLLVRGRRVDNAAQQITARVNQDARQVDTSPVLTVLTALALVLLMLYMLVRYRDKGKGRDRNSSKRS
ncbi:MAG: class C sortase [Defluviitaleaceae bacterium]|nr:class C sortase [Defluviitaleaceae bacterium]